jgi:hypothetical protein
MTNKIWTRDEIDAMLSTNPKAVARAMVVLWELQTSDEKAVDRTRHNNNRGFAAWAARRGSYYARWAMAGREITGPHLDTARKIALKHSGQLVKAANAKVAQAVAQAA